jgi:hypothetical protein
MEMMIILRCGVVVKIKLDNIVSKLIFVKYLVVKIKLDNIVSKLIFVKYFIS